MRRTRGQTGAEYMLAVSVVVIAVAAAFWLVMADNCNQTLRECSGPSAGGPAKRAFHNTKDVIEAPFP